MRTIGLYQLDQMKFDRLPFEGEWRQTVGQPTKNFSVLIYGTSGNGKTTAIIRFIKYLCSFGMRACYISHEEGVSGTMQDAFRAANMIKENKGQVILAEDASFDDTLKYFGKRGSPEIAVIDSIDYCNLTTEQYKILRNKLKNKIIVLISWSEGTRPKSQAGKEIEYMVDVKLRVKNFMIWPKSRYGGNEPYVIWEERARLLEQKWFKDHDKKCPPVPYKGAEIAKTADEREGVDVDE